MWSWERREVWRGGKRIVEGWAIPCHAHTTAHITLRPAPLAWPSRTSSSLSFRTFSTLCPMSQMLRRCVPWGEEGRTGVGDGEWGRGGVGPERGAWYRVRPSVAREAPWGRESSEVTAPLAGGYQLTTHAPRMEHGAARRGGERPLRGNIPWLTIRPVLITADRNSGLVEARPFRPLAIGFVMVFTKRIPSFIKGSAAIVDRSPPPPASRPLVPWVPARWSGRGENTAETLFDQLTGCARWTWMKR